MSLIAIRASDSQEVEAFSVTPDEWNAMRSQPLGSFVMPTTRWPAVLKRSIRGTQFFAYAPGYSGTRPEPESEEHRQAKATIARALRAAGYPAWVERSGSTPQGEQWQADVLCHADNRVIAFEVQLAQQTLEDYEARTARYQRAGVTCVWLVRAPKHYEAVGRAIYYRLKKNGGSIGYRPSLPHLALLPFNPGTAKSGPIEDMQVVVFPDGQAQRIPLGEFAVGVAAGRLIFADEEWQWLSDQPLPVPHSSGITV